MGIPVTGITRAGLRNLALHHAVEITFIRRDKNRLPQQRRMWMTLDVMLLNSRFGRTILNFKRPTKPPAYNAASKNLLIVWDIIMQDWRAVPLESVKIVVERVIRTSAENRNDVKKNQKAQVEFWNYFNSTIAKMTPEQKSRFMDT